MKQLRDIALVGLERAGAALPAPGANLVSQLPGTSAEKAFLLRLGVAAVRARAGRRAGPGQPAEAAPAETRPACSEALAAIVVELCRQGQGRLPLLGEALARMDARGLRVPAWCLVDLADCRQPALQPAAGQVAGERGRWLARHNPDWRWLIAGAAQPSPADRARTWEEGKLPDRLATLRAVRAGDPAEGRRLVEAVWKQEKAAVREELVGALEVGLGDADEPFLARALVDRAAPVRAAAARLLARLPTSGLAGRLRSRGEALLSYRPAAGGRGGALEVTPPSVFPADWAQDGLLEKPPARTGARAFWVEQLLSLVPPDHWQRHLGVTPEELVPAAARSDWAAPVLSGWLAAIELHGSAIWAGALWRAYAAAAAGEDRSALAGRLLPLLPRAEAESLATPLLASADPSGFLPVLAALPAPWGFTFGEAFLAALARALEARATTWPQAQAWRVCLEKAGTSLPASCFDRALALSQRDTTEGPGSGALSGGLHAFADVLATRKRIHEETRP